MFVHAKKIAAGLGAATLLSVAALAAPQPQMQKTTEMALKDVKVFSGVAKPAVQKTLPHVKPGVGAEFSKVLSSTKPAGSQIVLTPDRLWITDKAVMSIDSPDVIGGSLTKPGFSFMTISSKSLVTVSLNAASGKTYLFDVETGGNSQPNCQYTINAPGGDSHTIKCTAQEQHLVFAYQAAQNGWTDFAIKVSVASGVNLWSVTIAPVN